MGGGTGSVLCGRRCCPYAVDWGTHLGVACPCWRARPGRGAMRAVCCARGGLSAAVTHLAAGENDCVAACSRPAVSPPFHHPAVHHRYPHSYRHYSRAHLLGHDALCPTAAAFRPSPAAGCLLPAACPLPLATPHRCLSAVLPWPSVTCGSALSPAGLKRARRCRSRRPGVSATLSFPTWSASPCGGTRSGATGANVCMRAILCLLYWGFFVLSGQGAEWGFDPTHGRIAQACPMTSVSGGWSWRLRLALPALSGSEAHLLTPCVRAQACCLCSCLAWPA